MLIEMYTKKYYNLNGKNNSRVPGLVEIGHEILFQLMALGKT